MLRKPWTIVYPADETLMAHTCLSPFELALLRRELYEGYRCLPRTEKVRLSEGGTVPRFAYLEDLLLIRLTIAGRERWLEFLEHEERDLEEMVTGYYPISPATVRRYSALFGVDLEFLLLGREPAVPRDRVGASIEIWPHAKQGR